MLLTLTILLACTAIVFGCLWLLRAQEVVQLKAQNEESLKEHTKRLYEEQNQILNTLSDAFILIDAAGTIIFANKPTLNLVAGRSPKGRSIKELFLDEKLTSAMEESLATGKAVKRQAILPFQASSHGSTELRGETAWIIDAAPLNSDRENIVTRVIIRDVTSEHQSEQVRKDFVANASHELRTPLSIINGYLENLIEGDISNPTMIQSSLNVMQKHGERIARIVEDMLVISRLESGEASTLNITTFRFKDCAQDVFERLEPVISKQGAKATLKNQDKNLAISADLFYFTQVLFNLIENALKQNPNIHLEIEVGSQVTPNGSLKIWVADNGVGIPFADIPFIFRRFYRVEKHHNQDSIKGTGLGLSIVKRAIEAHGGTITASSVPGQQTKFEISLPASVITSETNSLQR